MRPLILSALGALIASASLSATVYADQATSDAAKPNPGALEIEFNNHCRECHSFLKGDNRLGPTLYGVVGRKAGTVPGFSYSPALQTANLTWDEKTLDEWITDPNAVISGNNMAPPFPGVADPAIRARIIAFLKADTTLGSQASAK